MPRTVSKWTQCPAGHRRRLEMRKLVIGMALALAVLIAIPAASLTVGTILPHYPPKVPVATATEVEFAVYRDNAAYNRLPSGLMLFTGSGDEFYVRFKASWGGGSAYYLASAEVIPGAFTLPVNGMAYVDGDSLRITAEIYCATDSVTGYWTR